MLDHFLSSNVNKFCRWYNWKRTCFHKNMKETTQPCLCTLYMVCLSGRFKTFVIAFSLAVIGVVSSGARFCVRSGGKTLSYLIRHLAGSASGISDQRADSPQHCISPASALALPLWSVIICEHWGLKRHRCLHHPPLFCTHPSILWFHYITLL